MDRRDNKEAHEATHQGMIIEVLVMQTNLPMYMRREKLFPRGDVHVIEKIT